MNQSKHLAQESKFLSIMQEAVNANKMMSIIQLPKSQIDLKYTTQFQSSLCKSIHNILQTTDKIPLEFRFTNKQNNYIYIIIGAEKGFCGGFNASILHFIKSLDIKKSYIFGLDLHRLMPHFNFGGNISLAFNTLVKFAGFILNKLYFQEIGLKVIYTNSSQQIIIEDLLPLIYYTKIDESKSIDQNISHLSYIVLASKIYRAIKESSFAEHMQRIISMEQASDNCAKTLNLIKIRLNKLRQEHITNEILQISASSN